MAAIWKEAYRPEHKGWPPPHPTSTTHMPGFPLPPILPASLVPREVWFVRVCSFTFEFQTMEQLEACLAYYKQKIHPTSRVPEEHFGDHWEAQRWFERLPMYLLEEPKRMKVVAALEKGLHEWQQDRP